MPAEPDEHDLLGFPGTSAELPKRYIQKLWLVAENHRSSYPRFLDERVQDLAKCVNEVVNTYVTDEDKRYEELCDDAFLEKEAAHILKDLRFGQCIWGDNSGAETRLQSNLPGPRPRWGIHTDSGYEKNDEDSIQLNLRYWMAARIQDKINGTCKEKKCVSSVTAEHIAHPPPEPVPLSRLHVQRRGSSEVLDPALSLKRRRNQSLPTIEGTSTAHDSRSESRARSGDSSNSEKSLSFTSFELEVEFPLATKRPKHRRTNIRKSRSRTQSSQQSPEVTSTVGVNPSNDTSTNVITLDMANNNNNNNNIDVDEESLSKTDQMKRKLQGDLTRFLTSEPDYTGILHEVIPPTKQLYAISPHRKPYSDLDIQFRNFNRALIHWESLIKRLRASPGTAQSPLEDPLQKLAAQASFEDRVAMFHDLGPRSHVEFPFESWTISLALFFEGLLGDGYMPFPFGVLVNKLRTVNQSLYDTIHCS